MENTLETRGRNPQASSVERFSVQGWLAPTIKRVIVVKAELIPRRKTIFCANVCNSKAKKSSVNGAV
jgi:hypothetical protein